MALLFTATVVGLVSTGMSQTCLEDALCLTPSPNSFDCSSVGVTDWTADATATAFLIEGQRALDVDAKYGAPSARDNMIHFISGSGAEVPWDSAEVTSFSSVTTAAAGNKDTILQAIYDTVINEAFETATRSVACGCQDTTFLESEMYSDFHLSSGDNYQVASSANYCAKRNVDDSVSFNIEMTHTWWDYYDFEVGKYFGEWAFNPSFASTDDMGYCMETFDGVYATAFEQSSTWSEASNTCGTIASDYSVTYHDGTCPCLIGVTTDPTNQPTRNPSGQPSNQPSNEPTLVPTDATNAPTKVPTYRPSRDPTSVPSAQPSNVPTSVPSRDPTGVPSAQPSNEPSSQPTAPTPQPSDTPFFEPTTNPTGATAQPSNNPTTNPSSNPTNNPSSEPTNNPTTNPSKNPTSNPSSEPTNNPSSEPTGQPSNNPSAEPSNEPTNNPSRNPSAQPSNEPTSNPSNNPTRQPSSEPSNNPTAQPSNEPTTNPTRNPSNNPTAQPSNMPSVIPTSAPTSPCTEFCAEPWAFVVDFSGSMYDDIAAVQSTVNSIIDLVAGTEREPEAYILSVFNDPLSLNEVTFFDVKNDVSQRQAFRDAVDGIDASGGGDCPEYAIDGIYAAIEYTSPGSDMFFFTDADSKNEALAPSTQALLESGGVRFIAIVSEDGCSDVDPIYKDFVAATGGLLIPTYHDEIENSIALISDFLENDNVAINQVSTDAGTLSDTFFIDASIPVFVIMVTAESADADPSITLYNPDGFEYGTDGRPLANVEYLKYGGAAKVTVDLRMDTTGENLYGEWSVDIDFNTHVARRALLTSGGGNGLLISANYPIGYTAIEFDFSLKSVDTDGTGALSSTTNNIVLIDGDSLRVYAKLTSGSVGSVDSISLEQLDGTTTISGAISGYDDKKGFYVDFDYSYLYSVFGSNSFRASVICTGTGGDVVVRPWGQPIDFSDIAIDVDCGTDGDVGVRTGSTTTCTVNGRILDAASGITSLSLSAAVDEAEFTAGVSVSLSSSTMSIDAGTQTGSVTLTVVVGSGSAVSGEQFTVLVSAISGSQFNFDSQVFQVFDGCEASELPDTWGITEDLAKNEKFYVNCNTYAIEYVNDGAQVELTCLGDNTFGQANEAACSTGCDFLSAGWGVTDFQGVGEEFVIDCELFDEVYVDGNMTLECLGYSHWSVVDTSNCINGDWVFVEPNPDCASDDSCDGSYRNPLESIKAAMTAIGKSKKEIILKDGVYTGTDNVNMYLTKGQAIRGRNGADNVILDCENEYYGFSWKSGSFGFGLDGLTIQNCVSDEGGAIKIQSASASIHNCIFQNNQADDGGAIWARSASLDIVNTVIQNNEASNQGGGIWLRSTSLKLINETAIINNYASKSGGGIYQETGSMALYGDSYTADNMAKSGTGDVGNEIHCDRGGANLFDQSRFQTLAENPLYLKPEDFKCKNCNLMQDQADFDYCDPDYSDVVYEVGSEAGTVAVEDSISITYDANIFDDNDAIVIDPQDTQTATTSTMVSDSITLLGQNIVTQEEVIVTVIGERPTPYETITVTLDISDDILATYNSDVNSVWQVYVSAWQYGLYGALTRLFVLADSPTYDAGAQTLSVDVSTNLFAEINGNYEIVFLVAVGSTGGVRRMMMDEMNNNVNRRLSALTATCSPQALLPDQGVYGCFGQPLVCPLAESCTVLNGYNPGDFFNPLYGVQWSSTRGNTVYSTWSGYVEMIRPAAFDGSGYGNRVLIRHQSCSGGEALDTNKPATFFAYLDGSWGDVDGAGNPYVNEGDCIDAFTPIGEVSASDSDFVYVEYLQNNFAEGQVTNRENADACIEQPGEITVEDSGDSKDDAFTLKVDGVVIGTTTEGSTSTFAFNPLASDGSYPATGYEITLEAANAPDNWGTYTVTFPGTSYIFDDGETSKADNSFGLPDGTSLTFPQKVVCRA